jgi:hypothetical protein
MKTLHKSETSNPVKKSTTTITTNSTIDHNRLVHEINKLSGKGNS